MIIWFRIGDIAGSISQHYYQYDLVKGTVENIPGDRQQLDSSFVAKRNVLAYQKALWEYIQQQQ